MDELPEETGQEVERNFVRQTYDNIAADFSSTRYKKWPKVEAFIRDLPKASLLLDVGCGNGKYLDCPSGFSIGCDISQNLLTICKSRHFEVVLCDMSRLPFRGEVFDAIICVAALHHVVGSQRRSKCLNGMVETLSKQSARLLVQVWSYEQETGEKNPYLRRNPAEIVSQTRETIKIESGPSMTVHMNRTPFLEQDVLVPFVVRGTDGATGDKSTSERHLRYYHVFKEKELDKLLHQIKDLKILESYYDKGNWCTIASRQECSDNSRDEPLA